MLAAPKPTWIEQVVMLARSIGRMETDNDGCDDYKEMVARAEADLRALVASAPVSEPMLKPIANVPEKPPAEKKPESGVSREGLSLVKDWCAAREEVQRYERHIARTQAQLKEAEEALGKWLLPRDPLPHEKYCIWVGDSMLACEFDGKDVHVSIRSYGKAIYEWRFLG